MVNFLVEVHVCAIDAVPGLLGDQLAKQFVDFNMRE